jgi:hypothetical protein
MSGAHALQSVSLDDTDSEVRGKIADFLQASGFNRTRLTRIVSAKKSQLYVDLKAAFKSQARAARLARSANRTDLTTPQHRDERAA